jgi:signal transduction histidine kinase
VLVRRVLGTSSFRLALIYAALTGISFLVLFSVIFWSTARFMRHQIDDSVTNELNEIVTDKSSASTEGMSALVRFMTHHSSGFYYLLQDSQRFVLAGNLPALDPLVGIREWAGEPDKSKLTLTAIRGRGVDVRGHYLFVGWSTYQLHEMQEFVTESFLWGLAASVVFALAGGVVMSRRLMRKIESVSETSRNIVEGDLKQRVPIQHGGDEFDHLAVSINTMLDRIEALMADVQQVSTDIAHDLRTPLTRLRNRLEFSQRADVDAAALRQVIDAARRETDVILEIFGALLRIAQIESGARKAGFSRVDLGEVLNTVIELYAPVAEDRQLTLEADIAALLLIDGDRELLTQLFVNLVDNAVLHAGPGAHIWIRAHTVGENVLVQVCDDGPGIPDSLRTKVLQRFFRLEGSRTTPGSGLGLSLAAAIAKLHGAKMLLSDNRPGLKVDIAFL